MASADSGEYYDCLCRLYSAGVPARGSRRGVPGGYRAVQLLIDIRAGRQVPEQVTIAALVVTAGSLDDPKIRIALIQYRD